MYIALAINLDFWLCTKCRIEQIIKLIMNKNNSPYSVAITGCSFMMYEMNRLLPLLMGENPKEPMKQEIENNDVLMVNSHSSRSRYILNLNDINQFRVSFRKNIRHL